MFLACLDFAELDAFLGEHILLILEKNISDHIPTPKHNPNPIHKLSLKSEGNNL